MKSKRLKPTPTQLQHMKSKKKIVLTRSEALTLKLCSKLDRQYKQNVQLEVRLTAIYNMLLRTVDSNINENFEN